jgi:hypothetical protein
MRLCLLCTAVHDFWQYPFPFVKRIYTLSPLRAGPFRELFVALVRGNKLVYGEAMSFYATAGRRAATPGAVVPTLDFE